MHLADLKAKATDIASMLKAMANPRRLMVLCQLMLRGTASVNDLATAIGLSQSALSQHLALMRDEGIVTFDRQGQTLLYRIADPRITQHMIALYDLYCTPLKDAARENDLAL